MNDNGIKTGPAVSGGGLDVRIAEELVEKARSEGLDLTGPDGLLAAITRNVIQAALEAEMTEHLGYAKGDHAAAAEAGDGNHRNGTSKKTVQTGVGPVERDIPRDRDASRLPSKPLLVPRTEGLMHPPLATIRQRSDLVLARSKSSISKPWNPRPSTWRHLRYPYLQKPSDPSRGSALALEHFQSPGWQH